MTIKERQIKLETRMYRHKSFGREDFCILCFACKYHIDCIANGKTRSTQNLCAKAESRLKNREYETSFMNVFKCDKRIRKYRFPLLGLKKEELD